HPTHPAVPTRRSSDLESAGAEARHLHAGMTSSDLVDTALALQIGEAGGRLVGALQRVRRAAWNQAQQHRLTPMVGRTHGIHAEPDRKSTRLNSSHEWI